MSQVIIFTNQNGGVAVCTPMSGISIEDVQKKDIPIGIESFIVDVENLPQEDEFFDAWEQSNGKITVNLNKAKEITKNRLRYERQPYLADLDVAFQRALEQGQDTSSIVAKKQVLRDITKMADDCLTLDELKNLKITSVA